MCGIARRLSVQQEMGALLVKTVGTVYFKAKVPAKPTKRSSELFCLKLTANHVFLADEYICFLMISSVWGEMSTTWNEYE